MPEMTVTATRFKAECLKLIDTMNRDGQSVVVTRHGKPVARLSPVAAKEPRPSIIGSMRGSVLRYDDPFEPAIAPEEWDALR